MSTLVDLDVLSVQPGRGSFAAGTAAYEIRDAAGTVVGRAGQRPGSVLAVLRRHLTSYAYRTPATFDLTDAEGNVQLVVERRRASAVGTGVTATAQLADGTPVAVTTGSGGLGSGFTLTDPDGAALAAFARVEGLGYAVIEADGRVLADVEYLPVTRSVVNRSGRDVPGYEIEFRAEAPARVRIATLATVLALDSARRLS